SGLLVDEELARAVRTESAIAIRHWSGVSEKCVWQWRRLLRVPRFNEGSTRLHRLKDQIVDTVELVGGGVVLGGLSGALLEKKTRRAPTNTMHTLEAGNL